MKSEEDPLEDLFDAISEDSEPIDYHRDAWALLKFQHYRRQEFLDAIEDLKNNERLS